MLRYSKKAKYLQLRLSPRGLEVVVPSTRFFSIDFIEAFIQKKHAWIIKNGYLSAENQLNNQLLSVLPNTIFLEAIKQRWEVKYLSTEDKKLRLITHPDFQMTLMGDVSQIPLCLQLVRNWLKNVANDILVKQLYQVSAETGLSFNTVSIRYNVTRWGSCSSQKNISLCCKLLLLPYDLMRHVLLHELCHTKIMHHGASFWKLLERWDAHASTNTKRLKIAAKSLPAWVY